MTVVFTSTWRIPAEARDEVRSLLRFLADASRGEPGNVAFVPFEDDSEGMHILEVYHDEAALVAHQESSHFRTCVERAAELGVHRSRTHYAPME